MTERGTRGDAMPQCQDDGASRTIGLETCLGEHTVEAIPSRVGPQQLNWADQGKEKVRYVITALLSKVTAPILCNNHPHDFYHDPKRNSEGIRVA